MLFLEAELEMDEAFERAAVLCDHLTSRYSRFAVCYSYLLQEVRPGVEVRAVFEDGDWPLAYCPSLACSGVVFVLKLRKSGVREAGSSDLLHVLRYDATITDVDALSGKVRLKCQRAEQLSGRVARCPTATSASARHFMTFLEASESKFAFFPHLRLLLRIAPDVSNGSGGSSLEL